MKTVKFLILLFPLLAISQKNISSIREKLMQTNKYEYIYPFENNLAVFRTFDKKMGVIDSTAKVVIKPIFSYINNKKELKNLLEVGNKINKEFKRGFIDLKGNIKIPIIYENVFYLEDNLISVNKDQKYGIIDTLNTIVLPTKFDAISIDNNLIIAKINGLSNLYDFQGNQISNLQFLKISNFKSNNAIITTQNKTKAIIDHKGNITLNPIKGYDFEKILDKNLFLIKNNENSKVGIIDNKGEIKIPCKYDEIKQTTNFFIAKTNNKKGFITITDSIIKPFIYDEIYFSYFDDAVAFANNSNGDNYIVKKENIYGVINPNKKEEVIPIIYNNIKTLFDMYYIVQDNENKNGLFSLNGEKILNDDYIFYNVSNNSIFASRDNKQLLIQLNNTASRVEEVQVDEYIPFKNVGENPKCKNQIFKLNEKFGVINSENNIIIPCEYELIENIYLSNEFLVKKNNKYGIVNSDNKIIVEIEYDKFKLLKESIFLTKNNSKIKKYHEARFR